MTNIKEHKAHRGQPAWLKDIHILNCILRIWTIPTVPYSQIAVLLEETFPVDIQRLFKKYALRGNPDSVVKVLDILPWLEQYLEKKFEVSELCASESWQLAVKWDRSAVCDMVRIAGLSDLGYGVVEKGWVGEGYGKVRGDGVFVEGGKEIKDTDIDTESEEAESAEYVLDSELECVGESLEYRRVDEVSKKAANDGKVVSCAPGQTLHRGDTPKFKQQTPWVSTLQWPEADSAEPKSAKLSIQDIQIHQQQQKLEEEQQKQLALQLQKIQLPKQAKLAMPKGNVEISPGRGLLTSSLFSPTSGKNIQFHIPPGLKLAVQASFNPGLTHGARLRNSWMTFSNQLEEIRMLEEAVKARNPQSADVNVMKCYEMG